jgi:hypothetical protein
VAKGDSSLEGPTHRETMITCRQIELTLHGLPNVHRRRASYSAAVVLSATRPTGSLP